MLLLTASVGHAESFFKRGGEGYFWYQDPVEAEVADEAPPIVEVPSVDQTPHPEPVRKDPVVQPFSTAWLRDNLPILLDRAMDSGKREDMEAFLYAQRVALDKAQNFAYLQRLVASTDPILDENNRVPITSFIRPAMLASEHATRARVADYLATKGGIFMFFDSQCEFCVQQFPLVERLAEQHGFETRFISIDGKPLPGMTSWMPDTGQFSTLELKLTPTLVYAVPPNNFYIIAQGILSMNGILDRLLLVAESEELIPEQMIAELHPSMRGVARWEDLMDGASDDPTVWVQLLRERLQGRY